MQSQVRIAADAGFGGWEEGEVTGILGGGWYRALDFRSL